MKKKNVLNILLIGNIVINLPLILSILAAFTVVNPINKVSFLLGVFILGFAYWSLMCPWYKKYSIRRLETKKEFKYWRKMSINTFLFWPDSFFLTRTEFWKDDDLDFYHRKISELT